MTTNTERVWVRVTPETKRKVLKLAEEMGISSSEVIRRALREYCGDQNNLSSVNGHKRYLIRVSGLPPLEVDAYELTYSVNGQVKNLCGVISGIPHTDKENYTWLVEKLLKEE